MAVPSGERFASLYSQLSGPERRDFVAALWSARGWTTTREDGMVVAERAGQTRRIAVDSGASDADVVIRVDHASEPGTDAASESGTDTAPESGTDTALESGTDTALESGTDTALESGTDTAPESDTDTALESGTDADLLGPAEVRNRLLYGIDRDEADRLFSEHFGCTLADAANIPADRPEDTETDASKKSDETSDPAGGSTEVPVAGDTPPRPDGDNPEATDQSADRVPAHRTDRSSSRGSTSDPAAEYSLPTPRTVTLVLLAVLLALAVGALALGTGAFAGPIAEIADGTPIVGAENPSADSDDTELDMQDLSIDRGAIPEGDPTIEDGSDSPLVPGDGDGITGTPGQTTGPPAGIFFDGVHDSERMATKHVEAIEEADALRFGLTVNATREATPEGTPPSGALHVAVDGDDYRIHEGTGFGSVWTQYDIDRYGDGETEYVAYDAGGELVYDRQTPMADPNVTTRSGELGAAIARTYLTDRDADVSPALVGDVAGYRVNATSPPPALVNETEDYRATAFVTQTGVVLTAEVTYRHVPTDEEVRIELGYGKFDSATVDQPPWYDEARVATEGDDSTAGDGSTTGDAS